MRAIRLAVACLLAVPTVAACGGGGDSAGGGAAPSADAARTVQASGTFSAAPGVAVTYDEALVPVGASGTVTASEGAGSSTVTLEVTGLQPDRRYGAHAHTKPCGAEGKDAGPHFQFEPDPATPSVDPAYANPQNEIWLDLTTDARGTGRATSTVAWAFPADRRAASVIIHAMPTATEQGKAGTAGDRAACITAGF
jgi:Cu-Zn family superoxide dismutase